jgi:hypothetical protein
VRRFDLARSKSQRFVEAHAIEDLGGISLQRMKQIVDDRSHRAVPSHRLDERRREIHHHGLELRTARSP